MAFNQQMLKELRRLGFTRAWLSRSKVNGDSVQYERWEGDRLIEVQLEGDERFGHRASNMLIIADDRRRLSGTTKPTGFATVAEMVSAIEHERTRADHLPSGSILAGGSSR